MADVQGLPVLDLIDEGALEIPKHLRHLLLQICPVYLSL